MLLHTCCAPCSAAVIEWLLNEQIRPALYFFNPNIYPPEEYERRKAELTRYAHSQDLEVIDGDADHASTTLRLRSGNTLSDHAAWLAYAVRTEQDERAPERGSRCLHCFRYRLLATARLAHERGFARFATTLASSRWKDLTQITEAGHWAAAQTRLLSVFPEQSVAMSLSNCRRVADVQFFDKNWRKDGLSERRRALLAQHQFYNQTYCGCEFSKNNVHLPPL